jgi:hypothetical protein
MIPSGSVAVAYCTLSWKRKTSMLVVMLLAASMAWTQATTSLRGTVTDPDGKAVTGADVVLANAESRTERTVTTGNQGEYQFLLVPPGSYSLTVKAAGFRGYEQTNLVLLVSTPATANVQLKVGAATEILTVTSEAPAINLVDASLGNSFNETQVQDIPLEGRNVPDLLSLQAGVSYTGNHNAIDKDQDTRNGSVNGARSDQSNVTLDNVDVNDQSNGYAFTSVLPVTQDSVQEFRVTTTNYGADQGQGSGAQVALVTKSGTNMYHGALYEDMRNTITSANDYLVKQSEQNIGLPNKPLQLNRNIFGAAVGGPIQKDRLFFFANYEGTREREEQRSERIIPTPTLCQGIFRYYNDAAGDMTVMHSGDLKNLDPKGLGIDPAMLDLVGHTGYLDRTFCTGQTPTNDIAAGDGLNYAGYVFRGPTKLDNDAFIARLDYHLTADGKHSLFWRGNLNDLRNPGAPFLPGKYQTFPGELNPSAPTQITVDHSKGFALGYIVVLNSTMVNSFHWGFTRQSFGIIGNTDQQWNTFLGLDQGINFSHNFQLPLHNFVDDFTWTKGTHSFQFGTSIKIARNPRTSFLHSNTLALGTTNWTSPIGFAGTTSTLDPQNGTAHPLLNIPGSPPGKAPEPVTATQYDRPLLSLYGMISDVVANYNLDRNGNVVPGSSCPGGTCGAPVNRRYGLDSYEFYGQDSWRIKPNLTLTYGLRWSFFPAPWETNGFQASTTFGLGSQFAQNVRNMNQGIGYGAMGSIDFSPSGPANNGPGFYPLEKTDWSPRISIAYSPRADSGFFRKIFGDNDKTVIRAGFSRVYDRAGFALINSFDQIGAAGFSTTIQNACCTFGVTSAEDLPRITGINAIPANNINGFPFLQPPPQPPGFPQTIPFNSEANLWGNDNTLKTPHAYTADFSIGRELPHRFSLQVSYVGRFGRDLLTQRDLTQPLNIKDPISGIDYYTAASALSNKARQFALANNGGQATNYYQAVITPAQISNLKASDLGPTAQYWVDMLPKLPAGATHYTDNFQTGIVPSNNPTDSLIQEVFNLYYNPGLSVIGDEIVGLADVDVYEGLGDDQGHYYTFCAKPGCTASGAGTIGVPFGGGIGNYLNNQAFSTYGWSSIGNSSYHALQMNLRKQVSHGFQFDFNYTWSKSIDITSAASRVGFSVYGYQNVGLVGTRLANAFSPNLARAVSDFDTTHQFNLNWIAELPVGRGRALAGNANGVLNAFIGGWQTSGVARWTSGFPFSIDGGQRWPTDWFLTGIAQMTAKPQTGTYKRAGRVDLFAAPQTAQQDFTLPLPGGVGSRNVLRGNGYAEWDMSLYKSWKMPYRETHSVQFRWDVFNVPNLTRFNAQSVGSSALLTSLAQQSTNFGAYTSLLTQPRVMQFALRYEF